MKKGKNRAKWLRVGLLGVALWIVSDSGLLVSNWERFQDHGSEALAQDLSGSWVTLTQRCSWLNTGLRCTLSGRFKVQNQGAQKALSSKVRFFLSDDSTLEETSDILLKEMKVGPLRAGQTRTIFLQITLPLESSASDKFVISLIDADKSVPETDETNNLTPSDMIPSGTDFFPFALGDAWTFQGTLSGNIEPVGSYGSYVNTRMVTGNKVIDGVTTTVFTESNPANVGIPIDEYLVKDALGITFWGSSGETGLFPSQMIPFQRAYFPVQLRSAIKESFKGIDLGQDLDLDGVNETADVTATVSVAASEEVTVPAGSFPNSVRIDTKGTLNVSLSGYHRRIRLNVIQKEWFAYKVGPVKRTIKVTAQVAGQRLWEEMMEELSGFSIGGQGEGIVHIPIAKGVATANSNTEIPGKPAIGSDGANYLVAFHREIGSPPGLYGVLLSESGLVFNSFVISPDGGGCSVWPCTSTVPAIAFDGANYLVVFHRGDNIFGMRIFPSGELLDEAPGFQISSGTSNGAPSIAFDGLNFMVVWEKFDSSLTCEDGLCWPKNGYDIYAARVTPEGVATNEFPIFSAPGEQINPSIAFDGTNYFAVWRDTRSGSGPAEDTDIYGTRVTPEGVVLDSGGIPISTAPGIQEKPQIIFDGTNYFAVWIDTRNDPSAQSPPRSDIFGTRIKPDGTLLDGPSDTGGIAINTSLSPKGNPAVGFNGVNYFVIWEYSYYYAPPIGIFGSRVSTNGSLIDGTPEQIGLPMSGTPPCYTCRFVHPSILFNGESYLVTWVNNSEIYGTSKDILGALIFP